MANGKIGVTTENIFPVIKKFLYSDHEIFLRELVSNAVDASQKLRTLASFGDFKGELGEMNVRVSINKEDRTLTVSDRGIGMTAEEVEKYINQIAFSGAEEFLDKYKDKANSIIGHFGLGFYSAFMVADKVEIRTLSYKEGAKAVKWTCDGSPEYDMEEIDKKDRGTDIILHIDKDSDEFLEESRIEGLLKKYCRFIPVPVIFGKQKEWKDGKMTDTDRDNVINSTEPLWTRKPADLKDEDYLKFYHELHPGEEDPMFWIHLNVDYPFTLTGILYFPKIRPNVDVQKNRIQLYCNQVYVTDQVEGVVPEFMMLMQGVIDSPDIPLNVSRSYLQADSQVKKISAYISKKVAEKLDRMFKDDRSSFESKWNDIRIFIEYGMLTDTKFYDSALKFFLFRDIDDKYYTLEEYKSLVESNQTDKDGNLVYIYATDKESQFSYIKAAQDYGYSVLMMDGQLDPHLMNLLESKNEKLHFVRADSDIPGELIKKENQKESSLTAIQVSALSSLFRKSAPEREKAHIMVSFKAMGENAAPATVTRNEFMRRMKEMSEMQGAPSFYSQMPESIELIVNTDQPAVKKLISEADTDLIPGMQKLEDVITENNALITKAKEEKKEGSGEKEAGNDKTDVKALEEEVRKLRDEQDKLVADYSAKAPVAGQIIDLALLQSGMLTGKALDNFIKRSVSLL